MKKSGLSGIFFILLFVTGFSVMAQKETNFWYFGSKAGLNFTSGGNPNVLDNSKMKALEGCTTISDSLGNLLFYTAGDTVYNKFHQKMNNGWLLAGDQSASQSSVIVKDPFREYYYYLFTIDELGNNANGFRYSVINVNGDNGRGSVVAKNIPILSPVAEKITVIDERYGRGCWVIVHGTAAANNAFYAYRVTPTGLSAPVISNTGITMTGAYPNFRAIGYMKASPDGQSLALAIPQLDLVELYKFNDSSGVVSEPVALGGLDDAYGVEFNREGTRLYVSVQRQYFQVEQFNLNVPNRDSICTTHTVVGIGKADFAGALQMAPNGRIYHADVFKNRLSQINDPDSLAGKARFSPESQSLTTSAQGKAFNYQGLPNFNQSYFWRPSFKFRKRCLGDTTAFTLLTTRKFKSLIWDFNDPASGALNSSTSHNPIHIFSSPGEYQVTLSVTLHNNKTRSVTIPVKIEAAPTLELGPDQVICPVGSLLLSAAKGYSKFKWSTGSDSSSTVVTKPGTYWLQVRNGAGCWTTDSIKVVLKEGPEIFKTRVFEVCPGRSLKLRTSQAFPSYDWGRNHTDSTLTVNRAGWYKVAVPYQGCIFTDSVEVVYKDCPEDLMVPNLVTPNGDGLNETFFVRGFKPGQFEVKIFNRWGTLIFEDKKYQYNWPKASQPDGTYFYQLYNPETGQTFKGWLEVVH